MMKFPFTIISEHTKQAPSICSKDIWSANSVNFIHARGREAKPGTALIGVVRPHVIE